MTRQILATSQVTRLGLRVSRAVHGERLQLAAVPLLRRFPCNRWSAEYRENFQRELAAMALVWAAFLPTTTRT